MRVSNTPLHRFAADCISSPDRFERSNRAIYFFSSRIKRQMNVNKYRTTKRRDLIQRRYRYGFTYECFYKKTHTLHIYVHTRNHMLIFCTYIQIFAHCNCSSFFEWHIYCVITLLSHLLCIYHVCAFVCTHMCVHMCIYTFHLNTSCTYILSCIYAHKILRIHKYLSTLVYLFVCLIILLFVCHALLLYIYACAYVCAHIFATAIVPELISTVCT